MALDILVGDLLIVGSTSYPIRFVESWTGWETSSTLVADANVTASTKRAPAIANGLRGAPATNIASLKTTPIDPASKDLQQQIILKSPYVLKECFAADSSGFMRLALEATA